MILVGLLALELSSPGRAPSAAAADASDAPNLLATVERLRAHNAALQAENARLRGMVRGTVRSSACALVTIVAVNAEGQRTATESIPRDDYGEAQLCAALALFHSFNASNGHLGCDAVILTDDDSFVTPRDASALSAHHVTLRKVALPRQAATTAHTHFERVSSLKLFLAGMTSYERVLYMDVDAVVTGDMGRMIRVPEGGHELIAFSAFESPLHGGSVS
jgi:hypothetical protein